MSLLGRLLSLIKLRRLAPEEMHSLAHELNRPLIGSTRAPPFFTSTRRFDVSEIALRAERISWFAACGSPPPPDDRGSSIRCVPVSSWDEAARVASAPEWQAATRGARVGLQGWLRHSGKGRYEEFSRLSSTFDAQVIRPRILPLIVSRLRDCGVNQPDPLISGVRRILWGAYTENAIIDTGHSCFFFLELFELLERGHCPCGWVGKWPAGEVFVY